MNENAARADWAGVGVRLPRRRCTATAVRLAVGLALERPELRAGAGELRDWAAEHDAGARAVERLEAFAESPALAL
jgi:UDP:flavonoid glycosyltransferase YjiC (YdhE family)